MKLFAIGSIALTTALFSSPSFAKMTPNETVAACLQALESGNGAAALEAAELIKEWRGGSDKLIEQAAKCMAEALPEPWTYHRAAKMFRPSSEVAIPNEVWAEERRKAEEAERQNNERAAADAKANADAEAWREANERRVRIGTMTACRKLLKTSPDAAFLNPLCVDSFLRDGLPES
ncbi:hypothetical protein EGN72_02650 [Pseudorhodobacter sp. E13]|uniref:hypothetical protein n=1 Tax=Pseudorhodobacter sp. E13 TaxID=2487931 RepID=UPI000F8E8398|nr:hypothetical protein [Pseudorhodobacter sp. E13]RUS64911.1 hypothetical protein EGN72_02650 [Pseudorhodobacter sp. E13]